MRVSEIRVNQIRVNQGLGVIEYWENGQRFCKAFAKHLLNIKIHQVLG